MQKFRQPFLPGLYSVPTHVSRLTTDRKPFDIVPFLPLLETAIRTLEASHSQLCRDFLRLFSKLGVTRRGLFLIQHDDDKALVSYKVKIDTLFLSTAATCILPHWKMSARARTLILGFFFDCANYFHLLH